MRASIIDDDGREIFGENTAESKKCGSELIFAYDVIYWCRLPKEHDGQHEVTVRQFGDEPGKHTRVSWSSV